MGKRNLPVGKDRKRWINKLSEEDYKNLSPEDFRNYKEFQRLSRTRELTVKTIEKLRTELDNKKDLLNKLRNEEESCYKKLQHLHNSFNCRIDITRQERKSKSLEHIPKNWIIQKKDGEKGYQGIGGDSLHIRKTYKGKKLIPRYVYHGKIFSTSIDKRKTCYFQEEKKLIQTIKELTNIDIPKSKNPLNSIKKVLLPIYKEYILYLMKKMGSQKFEDYSIKFENFVKWYKKNKVS